jgi:hypothetical protein
VLRPCFPATPVAQLPAGLVRRHRSWSRTTHEIFKIESDRREDYNIGAMYEWVIGPAFKVVEEYKASLRRYPNPPTANITCF